tara:strand:+ start:258 stop:530 length:273 start_codon:yes stop_codon:yes gene_type:complete
MEYQYPANDHSMYVSYHRVHDGPDGICVYYKGRSQFVSTPKELRACFGAARFTPSVKAASEWVEELIQKYQHKVEAGIEMEPVDTTKMIV